MSVTLVKKVPFFAARLGGEAPSHRGGARGGRSLASTAPRGGACLRGARKIWISRPNQSHSELFAGARSEQVLDSDFDSDAKLESKPRDRCKFGNKLCLLCAIHLLSRLGNT